MRPIAAVVLPSLLSGAVAGAAVRAELELPGHLLQGAPERVVRRAFIPSERRVHGEVVLARRAGAACVETILCSPSLVRGVRAIARKEEESWPDGVAGHADSRRFLEALDTATRAVLEEFARREDGADSRRKMLIEVVRGDDVAFVAFYAIDVEILEGSHLGVVDARPVAIERVSAGYADRAQRLQAGSAFGLAGAQLEELFALR